MDHTVTSCVVRPAASRYEQERALELVHENYVRLGYMKPHQSGMRINVHYALPMTRTFVAVVDHEVAATLSVFVDSAFGLPLDDIYEDRIATLRGQRRRVAEVGMLSDVGAGHVGMDGLMDLMLHAFWEAVEAGADDIVVAVNPRHRAFYRRLMCFEPFGDRRSYLSVGGAPAVLLRLDLRRFRPGHVTSRRVRVAFDSTLRQRLDNSAWLWRMNDDDLHYFFVERSEVFKSLDPTQRRIIENHFPGLDISRLIDDTTTLPSPESSPARATEVVSWPA